MGFQPVPFGDWEGYLHGTDIIVRIAGDAFEHGRHVMLPFQVFAGKLDITELVGTLSGLPTGGGRITILHREESFYTTGVIAAAVLVAHLNAALMLRDVEALRALDIAVAQRHVAVVEAELLAEATSRQGEAAVPSPTTFSTLSERRRI
jgi:hypothetical protein